MLRRIIALVVLALVFLGVASWWMFGQSEETTASVPPSPDRRIDAETLRRRAAPPAKQTGVHRRPEPRPAPAPP